ncbi:hypothetical protein ACF0H5_017751 [Mactra antiquata]
MSIEDDPLIKVHVGKIFLLESQNNMLRDSGGFILTDEQNAITNKYLQKFKEKCEEKYKGGNDESGFLSTFIRPDLVWEYVYEEPSPKV